MIDSEISALDAREAAFDEEYETMLRGVPSEPGHRVLDVGCGRGFFTRLLSGLNPSATILGVDTDVNALENAHSVCVNQLGRDVAFLNASAYRMPIPPEFFDLVFFAYSLETLSNHERLFKEMNRVLKPGGRLVILEDDGMHRMVLPLDPRDEGIVQQALATAFERRSAGIDGLCFSRYAYRILKRNGWRNPKRYSFGFDRLSPLSRIDRRFFDIALTELWSLVGDHTPEHERARLKSMLVPGGRDYIVDRPEFSATLFTSLIMAKKDGSNFSNAASCSAIDRVPMKPR
ncbi:class I SAM-dependent methyltransferase [Stratiformator vulcanicus]|uniref:Demethylmenaquinone methyltransferase n=1 Tax=Stratiformator vulcanicus TaxID=2527980 RepID=A0A517QY67_9PLAN|nr:class I SAM-dependent methyltransferase [Stratiformator vulcanicus]QDT36553.1 Demethylmenaquinone methyltransferase [Stratiformator vulcanicus]